METVSISRTFDASADAVRAELEDVGPFMEGAGFDEVTVDGDRMTIENSVGLLTIDLELRLLETEAALAYEQIDGIFGSMMTRYDLDELADGVTVTATTEFELDKSLVGPILDATIISRQRKRELTQQFDYLDSQVADTATE